MITLENISYSYPNEDNRVLNNINLNVQNGEIVLCTGPSGCGKTTLIRLINGLCPNYYGGAYEGTISIDGINTKSLELSEISSMVGTLFQDPERQFFALTVEDEIVFALEWKGVNKEVMKQLLDDVCQKFHIESIRKSLITNLSEGQKQKVGLAELSILKPKNLILDEPTANLDHESTIELGNIIKTLSQEGIAIFIVDHRLYWLKDVANRVMIMQEGSIALETQMSKLANNDLCSHYGLRGIDILDKRASLSDTLSLSDDKAIIKGKNICFKYKNGKEIFKDFNFQVPKGITVILGENGVGKTTLARIIFGLEKRSSGDLYIEDTSLNAKNASKYCSLVLQNSDYQLHMRTVWEELTLSLKMQGLPIDKQQIMELLQFLNLDTLINRHPQSLSGGQKQRLVISSALIRNPKILILDEPTSGLDKQNMQRIVEVLKRIVAQGTAVLMITHDLELIQECCDYALRITKENRGVEND